MRDFAEVRYDGRISEEIAAQALDMLNVDAEGFDYMDRKLLLAVIDNSLAGRSAWITSRRPSVKSGKPLKMCWSHI